MLIPALVWASGTISITPDTNLTSGEVVSVSGSGFAHNSTGSILECNSDPNQPTISVFGSPVSVSCSNPLSEIISTNSKGKLDATSFTIVTGTVGPPTTGTDSSGGQASTDAANYPCPPTPAQINAGDTCQLNFGDQANDIAVANLSFASSAGSSQGSGSGGSSSSGSSGSSQGSSSGSTSTTSHKAASTTSSSSSTPSSTTTTAAQSPTSPASTVGFNSLPPSLTIIVETSDNQPISGAKVTLDKSTSETTGKNGVANFQNVSIGKNTVTISYPGNPLTTKQLSLTGGQDKLLSIKLTSAKSDTDFILAGVALLVILLGGGFSYWKWPLRSHQAPGPLAPEPIVNNSLTPLSNQAPIVQSPQQVIQPPIQGIGQPQPYSPQLITPEEKKL